MNGNCFGLLEGNSYAGIMEAVDAVLKTADLELVRLEKIGRGLIVASFYGEIGATMIGMDSARSLAASRKFDLKTLSLTNPDPLLAKIFREGTEPAGEKGLPVKESEAIGFVETIGFLAMAGALDAMLKSARVSFIGYRNTNGLFAVSVRGDIAAVQQAVDSGVRRGKEVGEVIASHVFAVVEREMEEKFLLMGSRDVNMHPVTFNSNQ